MQLAPHELRDEEGSNIVSVRLNSSQSLFSTATLAGWHVYRTFPLEPVLRNGQSFLYGADESSDNFCSTEAKGTAYSIVVPIDESNVVLLVRRNDDKVVVVWDAKRDEAVAELAFSERVRGITARRDRFAVALSKRVALFIVGPGPNGLWREGTYATYDNPLGTAFPPCHSRQVRD